MSPSNHGPLLQLAIIEEETTKSTRVLSTSYAYLGELTITFWPEGLIPIRICWVWVNRVSITMSKYLLIIKKNTSLASYYSSKSLESS